MKHTDDEGNPIPSKPRAPTPPPALTPLAEPMPEGWVPPAPLAEPMPEGWVPPAPPIPLAEPMPEGWVPPAPPTPLAEPMPEGWVPPAAREAIAADQVARATEGIDLVADLTRSVSPQPAPVVPGPDLGPPDNPVPGMTGLLGTAADEPTNALGEPVSRPASVPDSAPTGDQPKGGCSPRAITVVLGLIALIASALILWVLTRDDSPSKTAATNSTGETNAGAAANPDSPLDGRWVLIDGLQNTYADMGLSCSQTCDKPDHQLTIDKASVTFDISGTKVTGGTFKTGYSSTTGDPCSIIESRVDATVTGNVDQQKAYGQLIVDGTEVRKDSCDSNSHTIVTQPSFHTSRFFFVKDDTLTLCYNLNATFDGCTTTGLSLTPQQLPNGGTAATFKRA
ncbi:MAG: hypothetical protein QOH79_3885 [Acidimicrobiaceae bacterium]